MNALGVKVKGEVLDWQVGTGAIKVPEGEHTFIFYNKNDGKELAEKTVNVNAGSPETFMVFQPAENSPIAFIDPEGEAAEEAAPEGFMKIKIANYAGVLIPYEKVDIVLNFRHTAGRQYVYTPATVIEAVGQDLDTAQYRLISLKNDLRQPNHQPGLFMSFMDSETKEPIKNAGGNTYYSHIGIAPDGGKNVFTRFLTPVVWDINNNSYLKNDDIYYYVDARSVF